MVSRRRPVSGTHPPTITSIVVVLRVVTHAFERMQGV